MESNPNKRERHEFSRRQRSHRNRTALTQAEQERAAAQREINRQFRTWSPRQLLSKALMVLGLLVAVQHLMAHLGWRPLPVSMGWQDLLVGYPMGALPFLAGAVLLEPHSRRV